MDILGKRKMSNIMYNESGIPYKDIALYGRYRKIGIGEELKIGAYELRHVAGEDFVTIYEPDFTDEIPKYMKRDIYIRRESECI